MLSLNYLFEDMFDDFAKKTFGGVADVVVGGAKKVAEKPPEEPGIIKSLVTNQVTKGINKGLDRFGKK